MEPTPELTDSIYREKVLRARQSPPHRKLFAPARLFDYARNITITAIRNQNPHATQEQVRELFRQRMQLARQLKNHL